MLPFLLLIPVVAGMAIHDANRDSRSANEQDDDPPKKQKSTAGSGGGWGGADDEGQDELPPGYKGYFKAVPVPQYAPQSKSAARKQRLMNERPARRGDWRDENGYLCREVDGAIIRGNNRGDLNRCQRIVEGLPDWQRQDFKNHITDVYFANDIEYPIDDGDPVRPDGWSNQNGEIYVRSSAWNPDYVLKHELGHTALGTDEEHPAEEYGRGRRPKNR